MRLYAWNTNPADRARWRVSCGSSLAESETPASITSPSVGLSSQERQLRSVVFPQPEGPMMATISPRRTSMETPLSAAWAVSPAPYTRVTPRAATTTSGSVNTAPTRGSGKRVTQNQNTKLKPPTTLAAAMDTARPICVHCGAPLFARHHGDMTCVTHGHFLSHDMLDQTFGIGSAEYARQMAEHSPQAPIKCPLDRYAMSYVQSPSGRVKACGCGRCGSLWLDLAVIEDVTRTTPAPAGATAADVRSIMALACARGVLTPAGKTPARR